jgi:hypothetical protein
MKRSFAIIVVVALVIVTGWMVFNNLNTTPDESDTLFSVSEVLSDPDHPYYEWVHILHGRVAKNSQMSSSIWSLNTESGTALIVSAVHTLGEGYLGMGGTRIVEKLSDPTEQPGATRIFLPNEEGILDTRASVLFILYHPEIPASQSGNFLKDITPRYDFFVGVIDSQKVVMDPFPQAPGPLRHEPPIIFDPLGLADSSPTYSVVSPDEAVLLLGYPQAEEYNGGLAASVGLVLDDSEAEGVIQKLSELGDEEGDIPYDPEVEMIIEGHAVVGMSGGGVYNLGGKQVGVLVRASGKYDSVQYVRAVRMIFIVDSLVSAFNSLPETDKQVIGVYLEEN